MSVCAVMHFFAHIANISFGMASSYLTFGDSDSVLRLGGPMFEEPQKQYDHAVLRYF